jgi:hypothetical protein
MISITALMVIEAALHHRDRGGPPKARTSPAHGLSSKARPPIGADTR